VDVLVENFAPGVLERTGLGYEDASRSKPADHLCLDFRLRETGPRRNDVSYDVVAQAMGGLMSEQAYADGSAEGGISLGRLYGRI